MIELAERLGRTVRELEENMSSAEYAEWVALNNLRAKEARRRQEMADAKRGRF